MTYKDIRLNPDNRGRWRANEKKVFEKEQECYKKQVGDYGHPVIGQLE